MGEYLIWLLVSGLTVTALYACYRLLLSRKTQATFNRTAILSIYAFTFLSVFIYRALDVPVNEGGPIKAIGVGAVSKETLENAKIWLHIIFGIYVVGVAFMLIRRALYQVSMMRIIAGGRKTECDGYVMVTVDDENLSPFSWRKYIVLSRRDIDDDMDMIVAHELSHLKSHHWIDLLVADLVQIVQWFNPVVWIMRNELKDIHEFEADERVISFGYDVQKYQLMLIGKVIGRKICFAGNSLSHGKLKRRLSMMNVTPSGRYIRLRALAFVPLVIVMAVFANSPKSKIFCGHIVDTYNYQDDRTIWIDTKDTDNPVLFVDGNRVSSEELNQINPSDIKAITVRKDQHPQGVIYVETK